MIFKNLIQSLRQLSVDEQRNDGSNQIRKHKRLESRIERQKYNRFQVLSHYRFRRSSVSSDDNSCADEMESIEFNTSEELNQKELIRALFSCESVPRFESVLNSTINKVFALIDSFGNEFDTNIEIDDNFFDILFLNRMSAFIGSNICHSLKIKIIKMFELLIRDKELNELWIQNLMSSELFAHLIQLIGFGDEELVEHSMTFLQNLMETNHSNAVVFHLINCGFISALFRRADDLKWKTWRLSVENVRHNSDKRLSDSHNKKESSSVSKKLFQLFSNSIRLLMSNEFDDSLRNQLIVWLMPLLQKFLSCPDIRVNNDAIQTLSLMNPKNNENINQLLINSFGNVLFDLISISNESLVFSILQLFNRLIDLNPNLVEYKGFGTKLINCFHKILINSNKRNKIVKEVLITIISISQYLRTTYKTIDNNYCIAVSDHLLHLLSIGFISGDRHNRLIAILEFEKIFSKYSFKQFHNLFFNLNFFNILEQIPKSNEESIQKIGLILISHIISLMNERSEVNPKEIERHFMFRVETKIREYLENISFNNCNQCLSQTANDLLELISDQNGAEDSAILPQNNANYYMFSQNLSLHNYFLF